MWPERAKGAGGQQIDGYEIIIDDDGPGIPADAFERIFERFYTDRPEQGFGQNSGLGLAISRQIIEAHGGRIRALNRTRARPRGLLDVLAYKRHIGGGLCARAHLKESDGQCDG